MKRQSLVVWNDAWSSLDEVTASDVKHRPTTVHTYGYILRSDETGISIAAEWLPAENGGEETYRGVTFIPRPMVIDERPKRRSRKKEETREPVPEVPARSS